MGGIVLKYCLLRGLSRTKNMRGQGVEALPPPFMKRNIVEI